MMSVLRRPWRWFKGRARARVVSIVKATVGPTDRQLESWIAQGRVQIGRRTYGTPRILFYLGDTGTVRIGAFCSIADAVEIFCGGNHRPDWVSTFPFRSNYGLLGAYSDGHPSTKGDVTIGNDVWIGRGATILSGVTIGNGVVIGTGAIVTKDVRAYAIIAGNPAREVKRRFSDEQIARLEKIRWWDWPEQRLLEYVPRLSSSEIDAFLDLAENSDRGDDHGQEAN